MLHIKLNKRNFFLKIYTFFFTFNENTSQRENENKIEREREKERGIFNKIFFINNANYL